MCWIIMHSGSKRQRCCPGRPIHSCRIGDAKPLNGVSWIRSDEYTLPQMKGNAIVSPFHSARRRTQSFKSLEAYANKLEGSDPLASPTR